MNEFITGLINTSMVAGVSIVVVLFFFSLIGRNYSARCRKVVWILIAFCCLIPFRYPSGLLRYTVEIPDVVISQVETSGTSYAESPVVQNNTEQAVTYEHKSAQDHSSFGVSKKEITVTDVLFTIWICVGVAMSIYYILSYWMLQKKIKRWGHDCEDAGIQKILMDVSSQYKMQKVPKLCILQDSSIGPFATGVLRNTIVLPSDIPNERDMRFIIKHEILHCKNKDILLKLFFLFVNIIHWFNPLVWLLRKAEEQDIEISCDEGVILGLNRADREEYGDIIMSWVEKGNYKWGAVSTGYVQGVKFIKRRFDSIINNKKKRGILIIGITCAFILLIGSMIHIQIGEGTDSPHTGIIEGLLDQLLYGEKYSSTDISEYLQYEGFRCFSSLLIFPETIEETEVIDYVYRYMDYLFAPTAEVYFECRYEEAAYKAEIARLQGIQTEYKGRVQTIIYDTENFAYPAYVTINGNDHCYEYALLLGDGKIAYIFLQYIKEGEISFPVDYLPKEYEEEKEDIGYSMYLFYKKDGSAIFFRE